MGRAVWLRMKVFLIYIVKFIVRRRFLFVLFVIKVITFRMGSVRCANFLLLQVVVIAVIRMM